MQSWLVPHCKSTNFSLHAFSQVHSSDPLGDTIQASLDLTQQSVDVVDTKAMYTLPMLCFNFENKYISIMAAALARQISKDLKLDSRSDSGKPKTGKNKDPKGKGGKPKGSSSKSKTKKSKGAPAKKEKVSRKSSSVTPAADQEQEVSARPSKSNKRAKRQKAT